MIKFILIIFAIVIIDLLAVIVGQVIIRIESNEEMTEKDKEDLIEEIKQMKKRNK